jgi:16S rRNA (adenine1518-N6/adenine1519-N6)-dimethyltransferase
MRKLGQHFLKNKSALWLIAESLELAPTDAVIEIGPGHGELTEFLRTANDESKMMLIEKDKELCELLKEKFKSDDRITVVEGDALTTLPTVTQNSQFETSNFKLVGNIPYYITGHLFRIIGELGHKPSRCVFTIQKEVAERICAVSPRMNRLAASVQFWARTRIVRALSAGDFSPPPRVSSAIVVLETTEPAGIGAPNYYAAVRALFAQPRKTILNNIVGAIGQKGDRVAEKLSAEGIIPNHRPQNLTVDDIATIAKVFF